MFSWVNRYRSPPPRSSHLPPPTPDPPAAPSTLQHSSYDASLDSVTVHDPTVSTIMALNKWDRDLPELFCRRNDLVCKIWAIAKTERLVQVNGTPASGKTTLRRALERHIATQDPKYEMTVISGWGQSEVANQGGYDKVLQALTGRHSQELLLNGEHVCLLFDEAQQSYWDQGMWTEFFKSIEPGFGPIIIFFCAFGSEVTTFNEADTGYTRTPINLGDYSKIRLWPSTRTSYPGLLLTREEAIDVIQRRLVIWPEVPTVEPEVYDYLLRITNGHVGAVVAVLDVMKRKLQCRLYISVNDVALLFATDQHDIADYLAGESFGRGLLYKGMTEPVYNAILSEITIRGAITSNTFSVVGQTYGYTSEAIEKHVHVLYSRGYLYSVLGRPRELCWVFPSQLHHWFYTVHLAPEDPPSLPTSLSLPLLCFDAIRLFDPRQIKSSIYRLGPTGAPAPKEAHFHFELYRTLRKILNGAIYTSPEYGLSTMGHSMDLFIPGSRWGIELIYDSRDLEKHVDRFGSNGSYQSLNLTDHILLNFRLNRPPPARKEDKYARLYHVVMTVNEKAIVVSIFAARDVATALEQFTLRH